MPSEPRGGSAPAQVRNAFIELIEDEAHGDAACRIVQQLMDCIEVLPVEYCEMLDLPVGSTFAQAAHKVRASLGCTS